MASISNSSPIVIEISPGELLDKVSILNIKSERIADPEKLKNIEYELGLYSDICRKLVNDDPGLAELSDDLKSVNDALWEIEDEIRAYEAKGDFGARFVELARSVYHKNDERAAIKREINERLGSAIVEEKSYTGY